MYRNLLFVLCLLWGVGGYAQEHTIVVLGDSLSAAYGISADAGWVALLSERLKSEDYKHYKVVNASISGDTTSGGLSRLPDVLTENEPAILILELGGNDGLRALSLKAMRENLSAIIEQSRAVGAKVLLVGIKIPPNYGPVYTKRFHQIYHDLADEKNVPLVPFLLENVGGIKELMQNDGIHPTAEAQGILLGNIWEVLEGMLVLTQDQ